MDFIALRTSDHGHQFQTITLSPDGTTRTLRLEIRRIVRLNKWFLSIFDAATGENILQYIPLVSSDSDSLNDIMHQFEYLGIGSVVILPKTFEDTGSDPDDGTLNHYEICWGDYLANLVN